MYLPPLALTMGDPAGIGPELTIKAWQAQRAKGQAFFWIGEPELVTAEIPVQEISSPSQAVACFSDALPVLPVSCAVPPVKGKAEPGNAKAIISSIEKAVETVLAGEASAVVTNPIAKYVLAQAGFSHPGHTEFLAELCSVKGQEIMMLASPQLRVVLTSIHISLKKAIETLSTERIIDVSLCVHKALRRDFGIKNPRLAIAGLNPHAGENGLMGLEEDQIIRPALKVLQKQRITIFGPMPPDTMFSAITRSSYDAAICLYHDQGLIPLKTLDMENGVNVTLGLPIIRTSPDHGTAFDIAGQGKASESSLLAALRLAADMARHRFKEEGK